MKMGVPRQIYTGVYMHIYRCVMRAHEQAHEWERKCVEYCLIKLEKDLPCFSFLMRSILWLNVRTSLK